MRALVTGFFASALIHIALVAAIVVLFAFHSGPKLATNNVPLRLSMFSGPAAVTNPSRLPHPPAAPAEEQARPDSQTVKPVPSAVDAITKVAALVPEQHAFTPSPLPGGEEREQGVSVRMAAVEPGPLSEAEEAYGAALQEAIEARKSYPEKARPLGHQGVAEIGFTVTRDGTLYDIRVVESSGSPILDQAAMELIIGLNGRFPFPEALEFREWDISLPIEYRRD